MKRLFSYIAFSTLLFMTATVFSAMPEENIPLFDSPIAGGIQLTIRLSEYDYIAGEPVLIECWIRNRSVSDQNVCIFPLEFTFFAKIEKDGKSIFDTEDGFVAGGDFAEGIGERKASEKDYYELEPGWSLRVEQEGRFVPLDMMIGRSLELSDMRIVPGEYNLTLRFSQKVFNGEEFGLKSWTGTVDSNTVKLRILPQSDVDTLIKQLNSPSPKTRSKSAGMLGKMKEPRAVGSLIALLKDSDAEARLNASAALGNIGDARAVEPLISLLDDDDTLVIRYAVMSLAKIGDRHSIEPLVKKLSLESPFIKCDILEALKMMPDAETALSISALLKDAKRSVRYSALHSLPTLLVTDPAKRKEIALSLIESARDEYFEIRGDTADILVEFSDLPEVTGAIAGLLKDKNAYVRLKAVLAIGEIKPAGAVELLTPLIQDNNSEIRDAALKVINQLENNSNEESFIDQ